MHLVTASLGPEKLPDEHRLLFRMVLSVGADGLQTHNIEVDDPGLLPSLKLGVLYVAHIRPAEALPPGSH